MACRSDAAQANGKTRCWRAPPAADAETLSRTRPRISETVQPLRGPRSDVSDNRKAAIQPRSLACLAGRGAAAGFGTAPENQARTTPLARESARESPSKLGTLRQSPPSTGRAKGSNSNGFGPANPVIAAGLRDPFSRALGALGRRFESCRPDHSHSKGSRGSGGPSFLGFFGPMCTSRAQNRFQDPGQSPPKASERALRRPGDKDLKAAQHRFASKPVLNQRQPGFDCGNSPAGPSNLGPAPQIKRSVGTPGTASGSSASWSSPSNQPGWGSWSWPKPA